MSTDAAGLPAGLLDWVATTIGRPVLSAHRHGSRREAWVLDVERAGGGSEPLFLRIDRALASGQVSTRNLRRETTLIRALGRHDIPAQEILGWNDTHCAALQSWVTGKGELNRASPDERHVVMRQLMEVVARLHAIDIDALDLAEFARPDTPLAHSLLELEAIEEPALHPVSACDTDPLAAFGKRWLINHAPPSVERTVLLQGDTGPANFLFEGDRLTAMVDWEWGHYGDPMEDLGNIWVRDYFYPSAGGDLSRYFRYYGALTGFTLDEAKIHYYKIHQLVRSVISLVYLTETLDWQTPVGLNLGYRAVVDLETCRAMMEIANAGPLAPPRVLSPDDNSFQTIIAKQVERFVLPELEDGFPKLIAGSHAGLARYLDLRERYGAEFAGEELMRLRGLLGNEVRDVPSGRKALIEIIRSLAISDEAPVLAHLAATASAQASLMAPLMAPWAKNEWARIS